MHAALESTVRDCFYVAQTFFNLIDLMDTYVHITPRTLMFTWTNKQ